MLEMRIIIAMLLLKYEFLPEENAGPITVEIGLVLQTRDRLPIRIKRRKIE